ncbi:MAG: sensor domain-containing diguanylate cyclase [Gemmatimonadota bacterium]|nr:sensor domain-containing diguanylate cyclase [Gemmatimonadota bacterium]
MPPSRSLPQLHAATGYAASTDTHETRLPRVRPLESGDVLREFVRNLREGIYVSTASGELLDANPAFLRMIGASSLDQLRSYRAQDLFVDLEQRRREGELLERFGAIRDFELEIRRLDGDVRTVLDTAYSYVDPATEETYYHGILVDITARKQLETRLLELSVRDPLTGCYNRRHLVDAQAKMAAHPEEQWGCVFIDIDHFKRYNDDHGHHAGDAVLVQMSRFLMRQVRALEAVVRVGGDEFVVLFDGRTSGHIEAIAARLRTSALRTAPVPFSLGWSLREPGESLEKMLRRADQNLLQVRVDGRAFGQREGS